MRHDEGEVYTIMIMKWESSRSAGSIKARGVKAS
jgi:hypothetical protein